MGRIVASGSSYYVVWPDGRKFGPAEIDVLRVWASERRILPDTVLEDAVSGQQTTAGAIGLGLFEQVPAPLPQNPPVPEWKPFQPENQPQPGQEFEVPNEFPLSSGSPYPVQSYYSKGKSDLSTAWGLIVGGFVMLFFSVCCYLIFPASFALTGVGIYYAGRAKRGNEPGAQAAYITGIVFLCIEVLVVVAGIVFLAAMMGFGGRGGF